MIKRVFTFLLLSLFIAGIAFAASGRDLGHGIGDVRGQGKLPSDPHKIFRLVRVMQPSSGADTATLVADSIVIWDLTSDDGVTVTTTTTSPDSAVAGIIVQAALTPEDFGSASARGFTAFEDIGNRNWTWLQTYGKSEVRVNATNSVYAGSAMGTSATAGEADIFVASTTASEKQGNAGFFYDAGAAAADDVECFLRCD